MGLNRVNLRLKHKFQKKYVNTKTPTLEYKLALLKHDLKATCKKFKYSKRKYQHKTINRSFSKRVYRNFRGIKINIENLPSNDEVESFWKSIWCKNITFNKDAPWINDLFVNYCKDAKQNIYSIDLKTINTVINKINPSKAPDSDLIIGFWYKKLDCYGENFVTFCKTPTMGKLIFLIGYQKTTLTPKNENTHIAKNYRPLACLNIIYKIYKSCLNIFLQEHCIRNNTITRTSSWKTQGVGLC